MFHAGRNFQQNYSGRRKWHISSRTIFCIVFTFGQNDRTKSLMVIQCCSPIMMIVSADGASQCVSSSFLLSSEVWTCLNAYMWKWHPEAVQRGSYTKNLICRSNSIFSTSNFLNILPLDEYSVSFKQRKDEIVLNLRFQYHQILRLGVRYVLSSFITQRGAGTMLHGVLYWETGVPRPFAGKLIQDFL